VLVGHKRIVIGLAGQPIYEPNLFSLNPNPTNFVLNSRVVLKIGNPNVNHPNLSDLSCYFMKKKKGRIVEAGIKKKTLKQML
jgi:hypothetical protein